MWNRNTLSHSFLRYVEPHSDQFHLDYWALSVSTSKKERHYRWQQRQQGFKTLISFSKILG